MKILKKKLTQSNSKKTMKYSTSIFELKEKELSFSKVKIEKKIKSPTKIRKKFNLSMNPSETIPSGKEINNLEEMHWNQLNEESVGNYLSMQRKSIFSFLNFYKSNAEELIKPKAIFEGHEHSVTCISFSPTEDMFASASKDCSIKLWDLSTNKEIFDLKSHDDWINTVVFNKAGNLIASGGDDFLVFLYENIQSKEENEVKAIELQGHSKGVMIVCFHPENSELLLSGAEDDSIIIWNIQSKIQVNILKNLHEGIYTIGLYNFFFLLFLNFV